ncbi:hypothetical protein INT45_002837 [Circinella minor]|uniref:Uncharacterized protein n=1 Tax=Circinella minor TaxID=1195481 RepID=A0A8H7RZ16_9FUNG|nr:hypothetical protein INT45_002837 [Circinella minor]
MSYSSYTVSNQSSLEEDITNHTTVFEPWRFSANDQTLLFNFKKNIQTEDEAISILIQHYGTENIRFARRTIPNKVPVAIWNRYYSNRNSINDSYKENDLLIEVLFHRKSIRHDALCFGVKHKDIIYLPWTTCSFEHTHAYAVTLYGLPPTTEAKANSLVQSFCKAFMFKFETMERLPPVDQGMAYIRHVWLHKVSDVYCGSATVILHNVDERLAKPIREIVTFDTPYDGVPSYPDIRTFIQPCFMYCNQCRTFNMHKTKDCVIFDIINLQGNTHDYNEQHYREHGLNQKFQLP